MEKIKVLFVCVHNSARSQIAEAFLKEMAPDKFIVESAGFDPQPLNPLAIEVMKEVGIDISGNKAKDIFELYRSGKIFNYIISVCDEAHGERCPIFPGTLQKVTWSFPNPAEFTGTNEEKLYQTRKVRDEIKEKITHFIPTIQ